MLVGTVMVFTGGVLGWGAKGHEAVGYIAMEFLAPNAQSFVESALADFDGSLGPASTWADSVKKKKGYTWTAPLHYVDAEDDPPRSCSLDFDRDCADGKCILTAIANFTAQVVDTSLSDKQRSEALKFLDHLIGDIGQPLHVEAIERGGNGITVKCGGHSTNLHSAWDTGIIEKYIDAEFDGSLMGWVNNLITRIQTGDYAATAESWIICEPGISLFKGADCSQEPMLQPDPSLECPIMWAEEANQYNCLHVFNFTSSRTDVCAGKYLTNAVPVIELQIAKQGYRLAAWLNALFDGAPPTDEL